MHQRKHEISACIKSVGSAVCPEHLLEVEQAYKDAQVKKKSVNDELNTKKQVFFERGEYLHRLKTNALVASREVPLLRSELLKLKEEIFSLTFATERWGKTCTQQEEKIAVLEDKKLKLEKTFSALEEKTKTISREISQTEDDLQIFSDAINIFSLQKDASPIFQGLELLPAEIDGLVGQTPAQIIDSVKNMAAEIEFAGTETETFNRRSKVLEITIAKQGQEIDSARSRIDTLQQERAALQEAIDLLVVNKTSNQQDIAMLTAKYQVYSQIFVDSQETEDRHQSLVTQVNHANNYLKEALLANNRLELSLRLENFKINLLCQEMEKLT